MSKIKIIKEKNKKIVNKPEHKLNHELLTHKKIKEITEKRGSLIAKEFKMGIKAISQYPKSVTFFGSARLKPNHEYYKKAVSLSGKICEAGFAVVTGGGPGIMEAGNRGTFEKCGYGIGFNIELPFEQVINPYVTHGVNFHYFFTRKVSMTFSSEAYIYFPGGFGTMDEFFEIITLIQTKKIPHVPIVLVGVDYWTPLIDFFKNTLLKKYGTISKGDLKLFTVTDDEDEILKIVKKAKMRNEYSDIK